MKKILILVYDFPPYNSVGAQRPHSWFKYLKRYGYYPIVVTRNWNSIEYNRFKSPYSNEGHEVIIEDLDIGTLIKVPYSRNLRDLFMMKFGDKFSFIRRILTSIYYFMEFISFKFDARREIYFEANRYLKENKVDFIIASGEPYILFKYASLLSKKYNIPWIADYRDDWVDSHTDVFSYDIILQTIRRYRAKVESFWLYNASGITTVTNFLKETISLRTKVEHSCLIENGVDLDLFQKETSNTIANRKTPERFNIVYSGIMYDFDYLQDFIDGFQLFMESVHNKSNICVQFIGITSSYNKCVQAAFNLKEMYPNSVEIYDNMELQKVIQFQREGSILLNLIAGDPNLGFLGAKCYHYAALKKPILSIPLIKNNNTTFFRDRDIHFIAINKFEVKDFLVKYYKIFLDNKPIVTSITDEEIFSISRENKTIELTKFLNDLYDPS